MRCSATKRKRASQSRGVAGMQDKQHQGDTPKTHPTTALEFSFYRPRYLLRPVQLYNIELDGIGKQNRTYLFLCLY